MHSICQSCTRQRYKYFQTLVGTISFRWLDQLRNIKPRVHAKSVSEILPRGNFAVMTLAACLSSLSTIAMTFLPVYFTKLGGTVTQYGFVSGIVLIAAIPSTVVGGVIVPRHGLKKIAIMTSWIGPLVLAAYYLSSNWTQLATIMIIGAGASIGSTTSRQLIADATIRKNRAGQLSLYQTLSALPAMGAPAVGGYLVSTMGIIEGFRMGILVAIVASIASTAIMIRYLREGKAAPPVQQPKAAETAELLTDIAKDVKTSATGSGNVSSHFVQFFKNTASLPRTLVPVLAAYALVMAANSASGSYLIFYATDIAKLDTFQWGIILSSQLALANLIRTPFGMIADRHDRRKVLLVAIILSAPLPTIFVFMHSFWPILAVSLAMVAVGIYYLPTHEAYQIELTPRHKRPALFVVYDVLTNASRFAGVIIGGILFAISYVLPFYLFTILEAAACAVLAATFLVRRAEQGQIVE